MMHVKNSAQCLKQIITQHMQIIEIMRHPYHYTHIDTKNHKGRKRILKLLMTNYLLIYLTKDLLLIALFMQRV